MPYGRSKRSYAPTPRVGKRFKGKVAKVVRSLAEKKHLDSAVSQSYVVDSVEDALKYQFVQPRFITDGSVKNAYFNSAAQGTAKDQRIGERMRDIAVDVNVQCQMASNWATLYPNGTTVRLALVWDAFPSGHGDPSDDITIQEIWAKAYQDGASPVAGFFSARNTANNSRYQVLRYHDMTMSPGAMCPCNWKEHISLRGRDVAMTGSTSTFLSHDGGALLMFMSSSSAPAGSLEPPPASPMKLEGIVRVTYTDDQ